MFCMQWQPEKTFRWVAFLMPISVIEPKGYNLEYQSYQNDQGL